MNMATEDLSREIILDHYQNPRNHGRLEHPTLANRGNNPLCGDEIEISVGIDEQGQVIREIAFTGRGCSISQASASMMTEVVKGQKLDDAEAAVKRFTQRMANREPPPSVRFAQVCAAPASTAAATQPAAAPAAVRAAPTATATPPVTATPAPGRLQAVAPSASTTSRSALAITGPTTQPPTPPSIGPWLLFGGAATLLLGLGAINLRRRWP